MYIKHADKICDISGGVLTLIKPKGRKDSDTETTTPAEGNGSCVLAFIKGKSTERIKTFNTKAEGEEVINSIASAIDSGANIYFID